MNTSTISLISCNTWYNSDMAKIKVLKFGGTSVGSASSIRTVREIVEENSKEFNTVVVVSALGGITNLLLESSETAARGDESYHKIFKKIENRHLTVIKALIPVNSSGPTLTKIKVLLNDLEDLLKGVFLIKELSEKTKDCILSYGEVMSSHIITDYLNSSKLKTNLADPRDMIITDETYGGATVDFKITRGKIAEYFEKASYPVICPGFMAGTTNGQTITLGRGGSDYSAAILASVLESEMLEIWTDVSGMMTSDPGLVSSAHPIHNLSYQEAMELSHFGAKVIYPPTIHPVLEKGIPVTIKNTFKKDEPGTLIEKGISEGSLIKGLSSIKNLALLNLSGSGMVGVPNFSFRLFKALSESRVNVIIITQASSEHSICVGIDEKDVKVSQKAINSEFKYEINAKRVNPVEVETGLAIVALVGDRMQEHVGISGKMFDALGQNGINIKAIAQGSSERNITIVIDAKDLKKSLNVLHESFFLSERKRINVFMIGIGNVGSTLIRQISKQQKYLREKENIDLRITGIANSRKMWVDENGISLRAWKSNFNKKGKKMNLKRFTDRVKKLNLRNSIFVDNTADSGITETYPEFLRKNISVVTPNKIACSSSHEEYNMLKDITREYKSKFLFETNVGAGLPVISTLKDLISSGDKVLRIEAVLSGTLNYIFNHYDGKEKFSKIVQKAKEEGYTEPDPRIDLSGIDVMRKILILVRESGYTFELDQINNKSFIPAECMKAKDLEGFYKSLDKNEAKFKAIYDKANSKGNKLKYVATFDQKSASTGLQEIANDHPFYHLEGKDNIVLFYTNRYKDQPLVVKGAGAGAEVTASGIFADIIRIANS